MVIASPSYQQTIPGDVRMFACTFIGHCLPHWVITKADASTVTVTSGTVTSMFNLPAITEIVEAGTVSELEVTADLSLNGSTYKCQIPAIGGPVESVPATLTVFGRYWLMLH